MKRTIFAAALVVAALAGAASTAAAQPAPWQPQRDTAGWVFTPALSLGGLWDSNTTLRVKGDPQLAQWVGVVNPRGELGYNGQRTHFDIGYSGALEAYQTLAELTRYDQRGKLGLRHQASPRLFFTAESSVTASPTTERLELGTLPFQNVGSTLVDARGTGAYSFSQRTSMNGSYNFQHVTFDQQDFTTFEGGHAHTVATSVTHAVTSRLSIGGNYSYQRAHTGGGTQLVHVQDGVGMVTYRLAQYTTVSGGAGVARLRIVETGETQSGPSLHARITHTIERARMELAYDRTFVPSWSFGGTSTNEDIRASVARPLSQRMSVQGGVAYSRNEPLQLTGDRLLLNSWWTGASVGYAVARWLSIEGFYAGDFQHTSAFGQVNRTRVGIQIVTLKPVRIQ